MTKLEFPKNPTTSWVIRTQNEERWLGKVLETLFMQSRLDFEVIIVDNESEDRTLEIIKSWPIRKVISVPRKDYNHSYALNLGINEGWGELAGIVNGHCLPVSRTWYQDAMKNFADEKIVAVTGHYTALPDGDISEKLGDLHFDLSRLEKEHDCKWMTNTNTIIRKDNWREYPFDEMLEECEDYDWACEMLARGFDVVKDPKFNVYHSHGGIGRSVFEDRVARWEVLCGEIDKRKRPRKSFTKVKIK